MVHILTEGVRAGERGNVWSFNYFFHNKRLKRILYFSCRGLSKTAVDSRNTSVANTSSGFHESPSEEEDEEHHSEEAVGRYGMADTMDL